MTDKKKILHHSRLYVVLDSSGADFKKLFTILKETVNAGTTIVQLRSKEGSARDILQFSKRAVRHLKNRALFIVNDRVDLARASGSDGVHLGQDDMPLPEVRKIFGKDKLIGVSCQTIAQVRRAVKQGADYIGFGSVFKTKTKPGRRPQDLKILAKVQSETRLPIFFIGGITLNNVQRILKNGGQRVAVTRAICEAKDVRQTTKEFFKILRLCEEGA